MVRGVRRCLIVAVLVWAGLTGCSQSFLAGDSNDNQEEAEREESNPSHRYVLVAAGPEKLDVGVEKTAPLKVFLFEKSSGDAVTDEVVEFEIVSGLRRGSIGARRTTTNENGGAAVRFRAGSTPGAVRVEASHPEAKKVTFGLDLQPEPSGTLELELVNTGSTVMPLTDIGVRLYDSEKFDCREFLPLADKQPRGLRAKVRSKAGTSVPFGNLPVKKTYTVAAVARGNRGQIAAGGCRTDLTVPENKVVEKELLLHLIPINPAGRYDATTIYDFSNAVAESGVVGENILRVLAVFENPGKALYNEIINLVEAAVGDLAGQGIDWLLDQTGLDEDFRNLINSTVQNNETLCKIREVGRDLRDMVTDLHVDSELTIGRLRSSYEFRGRNNWTNVTFYWRTQCDGVIEEVCSKDEDPMGGARIERDRPCAAVQLAPEDSEEIEEIGLWSTQWKGRVLSYDRLQVDRHPVPLRYGKLLSYVLDHVVLPELTDGNANSLVDAFAYWLGCDSLASSVTGSDGEVCAPDPIDACLTDQDIAGFCESAIKTVFGAADFLIGELKLDTGIYVGGEALLVETTSDGRVDYIEDGTIDGYVEVSKEGLAKGRSKVGGSWSAERVSTEGVSESE